MGGRTTGGWRGLDPGLGLEGSETGRVQAAAASDQAQSSQAGGRAVRWQAGTWRECVGPGRPCGGCQKDVLSDMKGLTGPEMSEMSDFCQKNVLSDKGFYHMKGLTGPEMSEMLDFCQISVWPDRAQMSEMSDFCQKDRGEGKGSVRYATQCF